MKKITKLTNLVILLSCCFFIISINAFSQDEKPSPTYGHTFVTVADGNDTLILLFGGDNDAKIVINELWAYNKDNSEWEKDEQDDPPPRRNHAAVENNNKMIVLFGEGQSSLLSDIWEYDPSNNSWEELPSSGTSGVPAARKSFTASVMDNKVIIVGGETDSGPSDEVWAYDIANNTWEQKASYMGAVKGHAACTYNDMLYIFGGSDPPSFRNDIWSFSLQTNSWSYVDASGRIPAESAFFGYASAGPYFYIVGGNNDSKFVFGQFFMLNLDDLSWTQLSDIPALTNLAAAFVGDDMGNGELYTFGGMDAQEVTTDIFLCYHTINGTWITVNTPQLEDNKQIIDIYPNPFNNEITISGTDINSTVYVEIYDVLGKLVYAQNYKATEIKIDLTEINSGSYILKIKDGNGGIIKADKILKQ